MLLRRRREPANLVAPRNAPCIPGLVHDISTMLVNYLTAAEAANLAQLNKHWRAWMWTYLPYWLRVRNNPVYWPAGRTEFLSLAPPMIQRELGFTLERDMLYDDDDDDDGGLDLLALECVWFMCPMTPENEYEFIYILNEFVESMDGDWEGGEECTILLMQARLEFLASGPFLEAMDNLHGVNWVLDCIPPPQVLDLAPNFVLKDVVLTEEAARFFSDHRGHSECKGFNNVELKPGLLGFFAPFNTQCLVFAFMTIPVWLLREIATSGVEAVSFHSCTFTVGLERRAAALAPLERNPRFSVHHYMHHYWSRVV